MQVVFVIPVFNEQETLEPLAEGIIEQMGARPHRILFVNDGSTDESWARILKLREKHANIDAIRLRRNFGKTIALTVGFAHAQGGIIVTMDADLQDNPREILRMLVPIEEGGYDVVCGWKQRRRDPWHKTVPSRVYNAWIARTFKLPLHDVNTGFKAMRNTAICGVPLYGDMHRLIPVFAASMGFRVTEIPVEHQPRRFGKSKYGLRRFSGGALDAITAAFLTKYGDAPGQYFGRMILLCGAMILAVLVAAVAASLLVTLFLSGANYGEQLAMTAIILLMMLMSLVIVCVGTVGVGLGFVAELLLRRTPAPDPGRYIAEKHVG
jgi:dolichol-phosphate mannosyltransferase